MIRTIIALLTISMITICASSSFGKDIFTGNKRKGKYLLRKVYKACNKRGEVDRPVPIISPADKTQAQWKELYLLLKTNKDQKLIDKKMKEFKCSQEWKKVKPKALLDIFTYAYKHASDSSTPAKCK